MRQTSTAAPVVILMLALQAAICRASLVFDDEFNQGSLDTTKWAYGLPWGNAFDPTQEQQSYNLTSGAGNSNCYVSGGYLHLVATHTSYAAYDATNADAPITQPYTSGCATTYRKFSQAYGTFEVSAQIPSGQGLWPAFWLLTGQGAPELDVFENLGNNPNKLYFTDHYTATQAVQGTHAGPDYSQGFHTYDLIWTPTSVTWAVDGTNLYTVTNLAQVPSQAMEVLLNLAVGNTNGWPGAPDAQTQFPATMLVDYVRVYSNTPEPGGIGLLLTATPLLLTRRVARARSATYKKFVGSAAVPPSALGMCGGVTGTAADRWLAGGRTFIEMPSCPTTAAHFVLAARTSSRW